MKRTALIIAFSIVFFFLFYVIGNKYIFQEEGKLPELNKQEEITSNEETIYEEEKENTLSTCIENNLSAFKNKEEILQKKKEVDNLILINNYATSVFYEDLETGFTYTYKPDVPFYGASLIKLVDALYLIEKATRKELDLDKVKIPYYAKYVADFSIGMENKKIGDYISLRDLITYAIYYSDNSAHFMLFDYIGRSNLREYGKSLGASYILTEGSDKFGMQTVRDTNSYLKEAYKVITTNEEYGLFLKYIMDNDERNDFNTDSIRIYHKYGSYGANYHDIGLSLEKHPYAISIFTLHEKTNHQEVVQNIHEKIRELHELFWNTIENECT